MQRSKLSLKHFTLWTQTKPQPPSWRLTLRLWWQIPRPAPRLTSLLPGELSQSAQRSLLNFQGMSSLPILNHTACFYSRLYSYLDEGTLFSKPTYAAFLALLDNYNWMTGTTESFTSQQLAEQDTFLKETMSNTEVGKELFAFLYTKGKITRQRVTQWSIVRQTQHVLALCCNCLYHPLKGIMHPRQSSFRTWRICGLVCTLATTERWTPAALNTSFQVWTSFQYLPFGFFLWTSTPQVFK